MIFKFFFCDAGLASEDIRCYNHMGERAYIVTQSIKKLKKDGRQWALDPHGFKRVSDDHPADITKLSADDKGLYYKDMPYTTSKLHPRLIVTYSPKYFQWIQRFFCSSTVKDGNIKYQDNYFIMMF